MAWRPRIFLLALVLPTVLGVGCDRYPQDPKHTLEQVVERGELRVGVTSNAPWVTGGPTGEPGGVEADLVRDLARDLGVRVDWQWGSEAELFEALSRYELDVVVGGITASTPWKSHVALTVPYYTAHTIVGISPSASIAEGLGAPVTVRPASGLESDLRDRGFDVQVREDLAAAEGPVAAEAWEVEGLGLRDSGLHLRTETHVMAVPQGENAMLMRLEDVLLRVEPDPFAGRLRAANR